MNHVTQTQSWARQSLTLDVCLASFRPLDCSDEMPSLMGYSDKRMLLTHITGTSCLQGFNFIQLFQLQLEKQPLPAIFLLGHSRQPVALIKTLKVSHSHGVMRLLFEACLHPVEEALGGPILLPTFNLDSDLIVLNIEGEKGEMLPHIHEGDDFITAISPAGLVKRLRRIYQNRLSRHGRLKLIHPSQLSLDALTPLKWTIEPSIRGYSAAFSVTNPELSTFSSSGRVNWHLHLFGGKLMCSRRVSETLAIEEFEMRGWAGWRTLIIPEHINRVERVLFSGKVFKDINIQYEMAGGDGTGHLVQHRVSSRATNNAGSVQSIYGLVTFSDQVGGLDKRIRLAAIALDHGFECQSTAQVQINSLEALNRVLTFISQKLAGKKLHVDSTPQDVQCAICQQTHSDRRSDLCLIVDDLMLDRQSLRTIGTVGLSSDGIGKQIDWRSMFQFAHFEGFHVTLSLTNLNTLQIQLSATDLS